MKSIFYLPLLAMFAMSISSCGSEDCRTCIEIVTRNTCTNNMTNNDQSVLSQDPLGEFCDVDFAAMETSFSQVDTKGDCTLTTITTVVCR